MVYSECKDLRYVQTMDVIVGADKFSVISNSDLHVPSYNGVGSLVGN